MWLVVGVGFLAILFAFIVGFFPPAQLTLGSPAFYVIFLIAGEIIFVGAPFIIHHFKKPGWMPESTNQGERGDEET